MVKLLVKLKEHSYLDLVTNQYIMADRPYVIDSTAGFENLCAKGKLNVLCNTLKNEATDRELQEFLKKDDLKGFIKKFDKNFKEETLPSTPKKESFKFPKGGEVKGSNPND